MKCSKCPKYSFKLSRCIDGKLNPRTIKAGVEAARVMGRSYICMVDVENAEKAHKIFNKM